MAKKYNIASNRILVGEFGVNRKARGADKYLQDLIAVFNEYKWHWAFYSFREDGWDIMDYELGAGNIPKNYWYLLEQGKTPNYNKIKNNNLIKIIKQGLKG